MLKTLEETPLVDTFRLLSHRRKQGVLHLLAGDIEFAVLFSEGLVVDVSRKNESKGKIPRFDTAPVAEKGL